MSDTTSQPDDAVDRWLADQRRAVADDLAATLDLEAGLREAMIPARHADVVADLRDVLDVEAGLSSIVPATPADSAEADSEKAPPDPQLPTDLPGLVRAIVSASPTSRLAMRTQPTPVLTQVRDRAHDHAGKLARDRARARFLTHKRARDLDLDLDLDLARALDLDLDLARAFAFDLARARYLARDLARALARARVLARDLARALASALHEIYRALNDFTGADLRDADLRGASLVGLRWSATTRWPTDWVEQIVRDSVEVEPGIFEVRGGGTTYAPTTV